jgi:hypothetical protein
MTDELLLVLGCAISFVAVAGAYIAVRAGFAHGFSRREADSRRVTEAESRIPRASAPADARR